MPRAWPVSQKLSCRATGASSRSVKRSEVSGGFEARKCLHNAHRQLFFYPSCTNVLLAGSNNTHSKVA